MDLIRKLNLIFTKKEKIKICYLFLLMFIGALLETFGVSLIVPLVNLIGNPERVFENHLLNSIYIRLSMKSTNMFLLFLSIIVLTTYIFKNLYLMFMYRLQYRFIYNQQAIFSRRLFAAYLKKPYTFHLSRNTAQLLRNVNVEVTKLFSSVVVPIFMIVSEVLIIICLITLLILVQPFATIISFTTLGSSIGLFFWFFRRRIKELGEKNQYYHGQMIKWVNQGLGASKEIKVMGKEAFFVNQYTKNSFGYVKAIQFYQMMNQLPRLFVESVAIVSMLLPVIILLIQNKPTSTIIPVLALFAIAAFRLMPSVNRINNFINSIMYYKPAVDVVYNDLIGEQKNASMENDKSQELVNTELDKELKDSIQLLSISYHYPESDKTVIKKLSLTIPIGKAVAFIGPSGAGKTTLVDIILGILKPDSGKLLVDGIDVFDNLPLWTTKVGYIPQSIYLMDDTIRRNVAFGVEDEQIEDTKIWAALEKAQLKEFVEGQPKGLDTVVGERGVRLSGGQRQRIGIARALYNDPPILVLDEATSALDSKTEDGVMKAIDSLRGQKTLIIIAHRHSTIQNCDIIYEIADGNLVTK